MNADVIVGPIANDTLFDTLGIISSGYLSTEEALKLLKIGPEYTQVVIKTEKAAANLRFIGSERIEKIEATAMQQEQDAYLEAFAKELEKGADHSSESQNGGAQ